MSSSVLKSSLRLGLGISLILLIVSSFASYFSITNLINSADLVQKSNVVIGNLDGIISTIKDAETGQRGFLITNDDVFLEPFSGAEQRTLQLIKGIESSTNNPYTKSHIVSLKRLVESRLNRINATIDLKKTKGIVVTEQLYTGKMTMDSIRAEVAGMQKNAKDVLISRTDSLDKFARYTPLLIVFAALLAILITLFFYQKVSKDYDRRMELQQELINANEETANRIIVIQRIAEQISRGDYKIRLDADTKDNLGTLAGFLNSMAESLQYSFTLLADKEWQQSGIASLNDKMVGEKTVNVLSKEALMSISEHIQAQVSAMYILMEDNRLHLVGDYAADKKHLVPILEIGEGIVGACFENKKVLTLADVPDNALTTSFATGAIKPASIVVCPIFRNNIVIGVMEFGTINKIEDKQVDYLLSISENIGLAIHVAQNRQKLQDLLEETQTQTEELQAQTEELQAQHTELEGMNAELEAQTQRIQASEEELRVQQEELLQSNRELAERSGALEEKNAEILERNLEIQDKAAQLELSTRYKSEFLANMSHELRTPLNSILLLSRLMADNEHLDKEYVEYASVIQSSGQGLLSLIDEILDLSKIEAGKMLIEAEPVRLHSIANDMRMLFTPLTNDKKLEFEVSINGDEKLEIVTDRMRLEQILKNLLSNAIKFTSAGKVTMHIEKKERYTLFEVSDTGIGIAPDKQQLIFEAFQQEDGSTRRRFGGTGLGLSISRELSKLLGGFIQVTSREGVGSTFSLQIPDYTEDIKPTSVPVLLSSPVLPPPVAKPKNLTVDKIPNEIEDDRGNLSPTDKIILIVEDDTAFAKALLDFTRKSGYKGIVAVRGDVGIEMAIKYAPLAILLDIQLPIKDGWQVMEELKSNPITRPIPVHIMSSLEVKKESLMKGAVDFINKPVALEQMGDIFRRLEEVLSRSPKKVLIVEENNQHANALSYYLSNYNINTMVAKDVTEGIDALLGKEVDCVILDMGIPDKSGYNTLDTIKKIKGLEKLPIIVFTGKNLSKGEESKLKQYADSIVIKTAHSYQRILDEAGLFLHLVEEQQQEAGVSMGKTRNNFHLHEVLKDRTVLIADDDVRNIFSLTKALEQHKIKVLAATDGKEALEILKQNTVDMVLMDMMMPEMDGYETTKAIRRMPALKSLPVIAVTAKTMVGDREKCIAAGASDYISKPVDIDQLISLLRVWLYDKN